MRVAAAMTLPRIGFVENFGCLLRGLTKHGIPLATTQGVFWSQGLTRAIEALLPSKPDFILTVDYDTVWCTEEQNDDLAKLFCLLYDNPDWDVVVPIQQKREGGELLAHSNGAVDLNQPLVPIEVGHFGLTLFRASVFERLEKPWFKESPDEEGRWGEGRTDADIGFWANCQRNGIQVGLAPGVVVGHLEQVISFPNQEREALYIPISKWRNEGTKTPEQAFKQRLQEAEAVLTMKV